MSRLVWWVRDALDDIAALMPARRAARRWFENGYAHGYAKGVRDARRVAAAALADDPSSARQQYPCE